MIDLGIKRSIEISELIDSVLPKETEEVVVEDES